MKRTGVADPWRAPVIVEQIPEIGLSRELEANAATRAAMAEIAGVREILSALQEVSTRPLVLRQIPIWQSGVVTGYVDLATERAYVYREHAASEIIGTLQAGALQ